MCDDIFIWHMSSGSHFATLVFKKYVVLFNVWGSRCHFICIVYVSSRSIHKIYNFCCDCLYDICVRHVAKMFVTNVTNVVFKVGDKKITNNE